jgi:hypothetical protein
MNRGDAVKLAVAIVVLIAAGLLVAWNFGVIGGGSSRAPVRSAEEPPAPAGARVRTGSGS